MQLAKSYLRPSHIFNVATDISSVCLTHPMLFWIQEVLLCNLYFGSAMRPYPFWKSEFNAGPRTYSQDQRIYSLWLPFSFGMNRPLHFRQVWDTIIQIEM